MRSTPSSLTDNTCSPAYAVHDPSVADKYHRRRPNELHAMQHVANHADRRSISRAAGPDLPYKLTHMATLATKRVANVAHTGTQTRIALIDHAHTQLMNSPSRQFSRPDRAHSWLIYPQQTVYVSPTKGNTYTECTETCSQTRIRDSPIRQTPVHESTPAGPQI